MDPPKMVSGWTSWPNEPRLHALTPRTAATASILALIPEQHSGAVISLDLLWKLSVSPKDLSPVTVLSDLRCCCYWRLESKQAEAGKIKRSSRPYHCWLHAGCS